ncbi:MAG: D-glycerate dehydrogenase [Spirochaetales bacterium]|nr:D-glycerate dehydrogenase [Spirochaetales bacterium]
MKKPRVLVGAALNETIGSYLESFCDCEYCDANHLPRKELLGRLKDKEGVLLFGTKVDREFLDAAPDLKAVCNVSVGYNNVDVEEARERGITVTNTPGVLDETVADLILSLMLSVSRRIVELDSYVRAGGWKPSDGRNLYGRDVHHTRLGIIGMGRIGEAVARRAALGFSMAVGYNNRNRKPDAEEKLGAVYQDLETLLKESDFIVLMTPLTEETRGMIGRREFSLMKRTAFFINASRGQTVDEAAMIEALQNGTIAGAGLDVFEQEPVSPENPLLKLGNVVLLPHIGSATDRTRNDMARLAVENLKGILESGQALTPV